jgi:hypothetical protein
LNLLENLEVDMQCYNPKAQSARSYSYNPDLNDDLRDPPQEAPTRAAKVAAQPLEESDAIKALMAKAAEEAAARQVQAQEDDGSGTVAPTKTPEAVPPPPPLPSGLPVRQVPEIEIPAGSGKRFIMIPKSNKGGKELFTLYAKQDVGQNQPLGLLLRDPLASSGFRVKWN